MSKLTQTMNGAAGSETGMDLFFYPLSRTDCVVTTTNEYGSYDALVLVIGQNAPIVEAALRSYATSHPVADTIWYQLHSETSPSETTLTIHTPDIDGFFTWLRQKDAPFLEFFESEKGKNPTLPRRTMGEQFAADCH